MTRNNIKNYFVMSVLILSASGMVQNHAFATTSPSLGTASTFAVLAGTTITCTGAGAITGDIGVWPGTAIVLGATPCTVSGTIHAGDPVAAHAQADAATAYGALTSEPCTVVEPSAAEIGGLTFTPGVYCFPSSAHIAGSTTLTLNGAGTYIFKTGSTLVTVTGSNVVLTGGATADNVFWAVGSSATLGTGSGFEGTIIAFTSITAATGATVDGRLIALGGAVTLDTNTITVVGTGNGAGDNDKGEQGTGDNDKGEQGTGDNGNGNHDNGNHDNGNHDNGNHDNGNHDNGNHDNGNHDNGNHDNGNHDKGHHDKGADTKSGKN